MQKDAAEAERLLERFIVKYQSKAPKLAAWAAEAAVAMEISEEWVTGRIYLNMETATE